MYMFMMLSNMRKLADTDVPMMPPMWLKPENRSLMAAAVAATAMEVMTTMLRGISLELKKR